LTIPNPGPAKHVSIIWHYARGIAFLRKNNINEAEEELAALKELMEDPALESLVANINNPTSSIAKVAYYVLAGEFQASKGNYEYAEEYLLKGIAAEDALVYSEPAPWHIPVRQNLGAILLEAEKPGKAEIIYRQDLEKVPKNGWSLKGLQLSLLAQGKNPEAREVKQQFEDAWQEADIELVSSVF
ncbi:MAG: tetratricopeptide repeat protein, partial [Candidatus Halalkalibacterium sp. M3_1C_030]